MEPANRADTPVQRAAREEEDHIVRVRGGEFRRLADPEDREHDERQQAGHRRLDRERHPPHRQQRQERERPRLVGGQPAERQRRRVREPERGARKQRSGEAANRGADGRAVVDVCLKVAICRFCARVAGAAKLLVRMSPLGHGRTIPWMQTQNRRRMMESLPGQAHLRIRPTGFRRTRFACNDALRAFP